MGFVKVIKNRAYYKRFQVQFRRRREHKTDYKARQKLVWVDKHKYKAPKYRFVVRFTNRDVITAIISSDVDGDKTIVSAYGHELRRYGLKFGFNNYASTYATALLCARRLNTKLGLSFAATNDKHEEAFDPAFASEENGTRRPFKAFLDVGIHRTTTGSRLFAAVKGACDGGVSVPHETTRFVGSSKDDEGNQTTDFEVVRKHIMGGHVADYMRMLQEDDEDHYKTQFAAAVANGVTADDVEALYGKIHEAIRAETKESFAEAKQDASVLGYFKTRSAGKKASSIEEYKANSTANRYFDVKKNKFVAVPRRLTVQQRKSNLLNKLNDWIAQVQARAEANAAQSVDDSADEEEAEESGSGSDSE